MIHIDRKITAEALAPNLKELFERATRSTEAIRRRWNPADGTPVFTAGGKYTSRGWTEWTQGFVYGNAIYLFDATDNRELLDYGRKMTVESMAAHVSHTGVHDHGFNNVSTYGNLLRLAAEGRIDADRYERDFYRIALKSSGAVQASRWTTLPGALGYISSFNGAHSLFADTIRSLRVLALAHSLGQPLMGEQDEKISLLGRLLAHAETTARYNVYFGAGRDGYDLRGRVAHESIFNTANGAYRCPSTQQGYSPFSTWTRGLAWILCGFAEQLEYVEHLGDEDIRGLKLEYFPDKHSVLSRFREVAQATADFYIEYSPTDGIPYWDSGAPGLALMGNYLEHPADPFNAHEPVDSSAAAIAAQGLLRLGAHLRRAGQTDTASRYTQAGLTVCGTLFAPPYLSTDDRHEGILLHTVYHRPNSWDHVQPGQKVPNGESSMWGDYHALELGVYLKRLAGNEPYLAFFSV